jgi:hypothetical protein
MSSKNALRLLAASCVVVASAALAKNGTQLASVADLDASPPSCSADLTSAAVIVHTAVTSSASASPASVYLSVGGGAAALIDTISDWSGSGRSRTAEREYSITVPANASTSITICYVQPGANGTADKQTCATAVASPSCQPAACTPVNGSCTANSDCCSGVCFTDCGNVCAPPGATCAI